MNDETILLKCLEIENPIYVDIETNLDQSMIWMICVYDPKNDHIKQFTAHKKENEMKILQQFIEYVNKEKYSKLYCYSATDFEKRVIEKRFIKHELSINHIPIIEDLCYEIKKIIYLK